MQSRTRNSELQLSRIESPDCSPLSTVDGETWREGGGPLQELLTYVLAVLLTLVFAWRIILGFEELKGGERETSSDAGNATKSGRDASTGSRVGCGVLTSINQASVGGIDLVTHDNAAAAYRVAAPLGSQFGAGGRFSLPANVATSRVVTADGVQDMPSRNCDVAEGSNLIGEQVLVPDGLSAGASSLERTGGTEHRRATMDDVSSPVTAMSDGDRHDAEIRSFRRRPLMWSTSSASDDEPTSPCSSDDTGFFHAMTTHVDRDSSDDARRLDDQEATDDLPEVTSSTWISLFRTFFMGGVGQQQLSAAQPTLKPATRRLADRDIDDLLDRTLSTISEEGADELARRLSELDDDIDEQELTTGLNEDETDSISCNTSNDRLSYSSDDEEDGEDYSDVNIRRLADNAIRLVLIYSF